MKTNRKNFLEYFYLKYLYCIPYIQKPNLYLAICNLLQGQNEIALHWVSKSIQDTIVVSSSPEPDPVEWYFFLISLLCSNELDSAIKYSQYFSVLKDVELKYIRWMIHIISLQLEGSNTLSAEIIERAQLQVNYGESLYQLSANNIEEYVCEAQFMLTVCGQKKFVEAIDTFIKSNNSINSDSSFYVVRDKMNNPLVKLNDFYNDIQRYINRLNPSFDERKKISVCVVSNSEIHKDPRVLKQVHLFQQMGFHVTAIGYGFFQDELSTNLKYHSLSSIYSYSDSPINASTCHETPKAEIQYIELTLSQKIAKFLNNPYILQKKVNNKIKGLTEKAKGMTENVKAKLNELIVLLEPNLLLVFGHLVGRAYTRYYFKYGGLAQVEKLVAEVKCDFYHANDIYVLPATLLASGNAIVTYDAHEYAPNELGLTWEGRFLVNPYKSYLCRKYIPEVTKMTTVCEGIANLYKRDTGKSSVVIRNVPPYRFTEFRATDPKCIRMVHQGIATPERHLEDMIKIVSLLPQCYTLTFMLVSGSPDRDLYINELKAVARSVAHRRVIFTDAVPYNQLISTLSNFDIGLCFVKPLNNINHFYGLPNKLFESIMAGLCIAINPLVEMATVVKLYNCGVVADEHSPSLLANVISNLSVDEIDNYKKNSLIASRDLNAENEMKKLQKIYSELLSK